jgi:hypothetical protein
VFHGVRHVHAVQWDPYEDSLWATTGDEDGECALWRRRAGLNWERVIGGGQQYRAVQLVFTERAIYFGTDAPGDFNRIYRLDRNTLGVTSLGEVRGPVFYGSRVGDLIFFATVCEPSDISGNRQATVWGGSVGADAFVPLLAFRKDMLPMRLFQYGQVKFPTGGSHSKFLWLTPFATELDQRSLAFQVEKLFDRT